ncbi:MAG: ATP-binding protein, partial [Candidatus Methylomirabilota bacterium]
RLQAPYSRIPALRTRIFANVPLVVQGRAIGVLGAHRKHSRRPLEPATLELLQVFASHAAPAIEQARLYEELRFAAIQLEAKVEDRTRELLAANQHLQEASRHKSEFLANMSHELRTPLNSILGFAQVLLEQTRGLLSEKQNRYLTHIYSGGQHLLQLLSDILDLSKVEAGKLTLRPEPLPVAQTLEDILVIARGLATKKAQELEVVVEPELPPLSADPVRFKQICFNLLSNAVKFTPEQGRITVEAWRASGDADLLELRVRDTGIGIQAEDLSRLFQEFVQFESVDTKRHEGTGLGLALTKRLVELHGGRIWAESEGPGRGACFVVRLPLLEPPPPKRILVIEDEENVLEALSAALRIAGYAVERAQSATQGLAALATTSPDLLVLDIGLPDVPGWTVLEQVRSQEPTCALPVLVLTGLEDVHASDAVARGADEFLSKPLSPRVLLETVNRLLGERATVRLFTGDERASGLP